MVFILFTPIFLPEDQGNTSCPPITPTPNPHLVWLFHFTTKKKIYRFWFHLFLTFSSPINPFWNSFWSTTAVTTAQLRWPQNSRSASRAFACSDMSAIVDWARPSELDSRRRLAI